jgi:adenylate cyclase
VRPARGRVTQGGTTKAPEDHRLRHGTSPLRLALLCNHLLSRSARESGPNDHGHYATIESGHRRTHSPNLAEVEEADSAHIVVVRQPGRRPIHVVVVDCIEIGRDCDGLLVADTQVSRRHVELTATAAGVLATDLGSTNGTFHEGRRISGPVLLEPGVTLRLGDTTIERTVPRDEGGPNLGDFDPRATSIDAVAAAIDRDRPDLSSLRGDSGTLTIVFCDIESSTQSVSRLGDDQWYEVLAQHDRLVRRRVAEHDGTVVKHQGDGFMLTFPSARRAVRCMIAVQRDLANWAGVDPQRAVKVRMGAHVGEAIQDAGDFYGSHVNLAARVANEAVGGQILVSSIVQQLVASRDDIHVGPGHEFTLKGLDSAQVLHEVHWR